jgi:hypothetical protein
MAAGGDRDCRARHLCHHPRRGDRLYTSYWHGGFVIPDRRHPAPSYQRPD